MTSGEVMGAWLSALQGEGGGGPCPSGFHPAFGTEPFPSEGAASAQRVWLSECVALRVWCLDQQHQGPLGRPNSHAHPRHPEPETLGAGSKCAPLVGSQATLLAQGPLWETHRLSGAGSASPLSCR